MWWSIFSCANDLLRKWPVPRWTSFTARKQFINHSSTHVEGRCIDNVSHARRQCNQFESLLDCGLCWLHWAPPCPNSNAKTWRLTVRVHTTTTFDAEMLWSTAPLNWRINTINTKAIWRLQSWNSSNHVLTSQPISVRTYSGHPSGRIPQQCSAFGYERHRDLILSTPENSNNNDRSSSRNIWWFNLPSSL